MSQTLALQIALMTLVASALSIVLVAVAGGLAGPDAINLGQIVPLALACSVAFGLIVANPFEKRKA